MGCMGSLFSSKKEEKRQEDAGVTEKDRAILQLKRQRDRLKKYKVKISTVIEREVVMARTLLKQGQKQKAMLCLKKKKYQEGLIAKTDGQLLNLEELVNSIEFASVQKQVFDAIKDGNDVLQRINSETSLEDIEKLMDESAEAIAYQDEVSRLLSGELTEADDAAIEEEYEQMMAMQTEKKLDELPEAPVAVVEEKSGPLPEAREVVAPAASANVVVGQADAEEEQEEDEEEEEEDEEEEEEEAEAEKAKPAVVLA